MQSSTSIIEVSDDHGSLYRSIASILNGVIRRVPDDEDYVWIHICGTVARTSSFRGLQGGVAYTTTR